MKEEYIISELNHQIECEYIDVDGLASDGVFEFVKSAIEKQIPKKTIIKGLGQRYCPVCLNGNENGEYCSKCGQRFSK